MEKLSNEVINFCKKQYNNKGKCGTCFLHQKCAVSYIVTRENIDNHVLELNKTMLEYENKRT